MRTGQRSDQAWPTPSNGERLRCGESLTRLPTFMTAGRNPRRCDPSPRRQTSKTTKRYTKLSPSDHKAMLSFLSTLKVSPELKKPRARLVVAAGAFEKRQGTGSTAIRDRPSVSSQWSPSVLSFLARDLLEDSTTHLEYRDDPYQNLAEIPPECGRDKLMSTGNHVDTSAPGYTQFSTGEVASVVPSPELLTPAERETGGSPEVTVTQSRAEKRCRRIRTGYGHTVNRYRPRRRSGKVKPRVRPFL